MNLNKNINIQFIMQELTESDYFYNDDLKEFERLNVTTENIYELDGFEILIILKDGRNLTDLDDVENLGDIIFISEDLSKKSDLSYHFCDVIFSDISSDFINLKAIVVKNLSDKVMSLECMFSKLNSLTTISGLDSWDTGNVKNMRAMFSSCTKLSTINGLDSLDVGNVEDMSSMFYGLESLTSLAGLELWDVGNVENMQYMFKKCINLEDISPIMNWNIGDECRFDSMFEDSNIFVKMEFYSNWQRLLEDSFNDIFHFSSENIQNDFKCEKCGHFNLIYDNESSSLICRNCGNVIRRYLKNCPDCGSSDLVFDYFSMDLACGRCGLIIGK